MKKVFIYAYLNQNLGDDLFVKILCERFPKTKFYIVSTRNKAKPFKNISNLVVISPPYLLSKLLFRMNRKWDLNKLLSRYFSRKSDLTVNIGGSIFMESNDWEFKLKEYKNDISASNKFLIMGANFGPYSNPDYYNRYYEIFKNVEDVCFRDEISRELFSELSTVRLAPDIVFSLGKTMMENRKDKNMIFSIINLDNREKLKKYKSDYELKVKNISMKLIDKGYKVTLMSFCEREGDQVAIDRIISQIPDKYIGDIESYYYKDNIDEALNIIGSSDGVISTRFHSLILGMLYSLPVYPLIYSKKITHILNDINYEYDYTYIEKISQLSEEKVIWQLENSIPHNINSEIKKSGEHFLILEDYLQ